MDQRQIDQVCALYSLGTPLSDVHVITGGLIHRIWALQTTSGRYAIKQLNPEIMRLPGIHDEYRRSEQIAHAMAQAGIPAVPAVAGATGTVGEVDGATVLVFPWIAGSTLPPMAVPPEQGYLIGAVVGRIHALRLRLPSLPAPPPAAFATIDWSALTQRVVAANIASAALLVEVLPALNAWQAAAAQAWTTLQRSVVVSHCDLDQKNVVWANASTPLLIDWEGAGWTNPTMELVGIALSWSGQTVGPPDPATFQAVVAGYRQGGGIANDPPQSALYGCVANWLRWLRANIQQSLNDGETLEQAQSPGIQETVKTLATLRSLTDNIDTWTAWL